VTKLRLVPIALTIVALAGLVASSNAWAATKATTGHACTIVGTNKAEILRGTSKSDVICGLAGNDIIYGLGGNDVLDGGSGNDKLFGGSGNDSIHGGTGNDQIDGGTGSNKCVRDSGEKFTKTCRYVSSLPKITPSRPTSAPNATSQASPTPTAPPTIDPTPTPTPVSPGGGSAGGGSSSPSTSPEPSSSPTQTPSPSPTATTAPTPTSSGLTLDFESASNSQLVAFSGDTASIESHPAGGVSGSTKAVKVVRGNQVASGTVFYTAPLGSTLISPSNKNVTAQVYSARAGAPILMKLEDASDASRSIETISVASAAGWQNLTFNFNNLQSGTPAFNSNVGYRKAVIFFDFGSTSSGGVYYLDQVLFEAAAVLTPAPQPTFTIGSLLWSDEFNATGAVDQTKWTARNCGHSAANGGGACHNNEQQIYTPDAITQDGSSAVISTQRLATPQSSGCLAWSGQCSYTSGRFDTQGKVSFKYGVIEARIQNPLGGANWPAFWLLGTDITSVGWPASGEIDVMEGKSRSLVAGAIHWSNGGADAYDDADYSSSDFTNEFHNYQLYWLENYIAIYVDGVKILEETPQTLGQSGAWAFNHPFFVILNNAVGAFGGTYDGWSTSQMKIDYVRHYQLNGVGEVFAN
jgi:beta-glucanase (GH16 family)